MQAEQVEQVARAIRDALDEGGDTPWTAKDLTTREGASKVMARAAIAALEATRASDQQVQVMREAVQPIIDRLDGLERDGMPDGIDPLSDNDGFCILIREARAIRAALQGTPNND